MWRSEEERVVSGLCRVSAESWLCPAVPSCRWLAALERRNAEMPELPTPSKTGTCQEMKQEDCQLDWPPRGIFH